MYIPNFKILSVNLHPFQKVEGLPKCIHSLVTRNSITVTGFITLIQTWLYRETYMTAG